MLTDSHIEVVSPNRCYVYSRYTKRIFSLSLLSLRAGHAGETGIVIIGVCLLVGLSVCVCLSTHGKSRTISLLLFSHMNKVNIYSSLRYEEAQSNMRELGL